MNNITDIPMACNMGVFTARERAAHEANVARMLAASPVVRELEEGYALGFPAESAWMATLVEFISFERRCCLFLHFTLEVEAGAKTVWLSLTGAEGVKLFLQGELGLATEG